MADDDLPLPPPTVEQLGLPRPARHPGGGRSPEAGTVGARHAHARGASDADAHRGDDVAGRGRHHRRRQLPRLVPRRGGAGPAGQPRPRRGRLVPFSRRQADPRLRARVPPPAARCSRLPAQGLRRLRAHSRRRPGACSRARDGALPRRHRSAHRRPQRRAVGRLADRDRLHRRLQDGAAQRPRVPRVPAGAGARRLDAHPPGLLLRPAALDPGHHGSPGRLLPLGGPGQLELGLHQRPGGPGGRRRLRPVPRTAPSTTASACTTPSRSPASTAAPSSGCRCHAACSWLTRGGAPRPSTT